MKLTTTNKKLEEIRTFKNIPSDPIDENKSLDDITLTCILTLLTISPSKKSKQANSIHQNI